MDASSSVGRTLRRQLLQVTFTTSRGTPNCSSASRSWSNVGSSTPGGMDGRGKLRERQDHGRAPFLRGK